MEEKKRKQTYVVMTYVRLNNDYLMLSNNNYNNNDYLTRISCLKEIEENKIGQRRK